MTVARTASVALLMLVLSDSVASAHGVMRSSIPAAGSTVRREPESIKIRLTEAPGPGTTVRVNDGCDRDVAAAVRRTGDLLDVGIGEAEPGQWHIVFRVASAVDGHATRGGFVFTVRGRPRCGDLENTNVVSDALVGGGKDTRIANDSPDEQDRFPIVPFLIGTAVLAIALILRRSSG
jgi:methionine-rich copper-binding protein CopC